MFFKNKILKGFTKIDYSFLTLKENEYEIPIGNNHPGAFGFQRKNHIHEGIDLYCQENSVVISISDGIVIDKGIFTGPSVDSLWWNHTEYLAVKYMNITFLYGELIVKENLKIGTKIKKGDELGLITPVLKEIKNNRPINMLHFECYDKYEKPVEWLIGGQQPIGLLNPIDCLNNLKIFDHT